MAAALQRKSSGGINCVTIRKFAIISARIVLSQLHRTSVTQGFLAGILCVIWVSPQGTFCERANYTHELSGN